MVYGACHFSAAEIRGSPVFEHLQVPSFAFCIFRFFSNWQIS